MSCRNDVQVAEDHNMMPALPIQPYEGLHVLPEFQLPLTAPALCSGRRVAIHAKKQGALAAGSREYKAGRAVAFHGRLVDDSACKCSLDEPHRLGTLAEDTEGIVEAELPQTSLDGLSGSAAFVNAGNLDTLTKHGVADK